MHQVQCTIPIVRQYCNLEYKTMQKYLLARKISEEFHRETLLGIIVLVMPSVLSVVSSKSLTLKNA